MMPPPNVTAVLHMGHGLNNTVQDVLVRFERMRGRAALWLPGTDHAGIATQNVVERLLAKEGHTRFDLGREAFVERVWALRRETGAAILEQLQAIGSSADWSRTYFTLDEDLSPRRARGVRPAVREGAGLPRPLHHQLVPPLPHRALQRGGGEGGGGREDLAPPLSAGRRRAATSPSPPPGPRRCWATPPWRCIPTTSATAHLVGRELRLPRGRPADPDRGRRGGGPGVRLRRGEGDAGARSRRLRDRPAARPARAST